jgi:hypothetical protein
MRLGAITGKANVSALSAAPSATDTTVTVYGLPDGAVANTFWVVIDPYTVQCEIRKVTAISTLDLTVTALSFDHAVDDAVLFTNDPTIYVDWFAADIAAALLEAGVSGSRNVELNPSTTYTLTSGITIPQEVTLNGKGRSTDATAGTQSRARIVDGGALNPMITLGGWGARVTGCEIDGNDAANIGISASSQAYTTVDDNLFVTFNGAASVIKYTQCLYPKVVGNVFLATCDVLCIDGTAVGASYYGMNHGYLRDNAAYSPGGFLHFNGKVTSINDDVEMGTPTAPAWKLATTHQSELTMIGPYYEGGSDVNGTIDCGNSGKVYIFGGEWYGDGGAGDIWLKVAAPQALVINTLVKDYGVGISGAAASSGNYDISCIWTSVTDPLDSFTLSGTTGVTGFICRPDGYHSIVNGALGGGVKLWDVDALGAAIDLRQANVFRIYSVGGTPTTITPANGQAGSIFVITTSDANITLRHGDASTRFKLNAAANKTLPAGVSMSFAVDYLDRPIEIGDYSQRL